MRNYNIKTILFSFICLCAYNTKANQNLQSHSKDLVGITIGAPGGINALVGYMNNDWGVRVSAGTTLATFGGGIDFLYNLVVTDNFSLSPILSNGFVFGSGELALIGVSEIINVTGAVSYTTLGLNTNIYGIDFTAGYGIADFNINNKTISLTVGYLWEL